MVIVLVGLIEFEKYNLWMILRSIEIFYASIGEKKSIKTKLHCSTKSMCCFSDVFVLLRIERIEIDWIWKKDERCEQGTWYIFIQLLHTFRSKSSCLNNYGARNRLNENPEKCRRCAWDNAVYVDKIYYVALSIARWNMEMNRIEPKQFSFIRCVVVILAGNWFSV